MTDAAMLVARSTLFCARLPEPVPLGPHQAYVLDESYEPGSSPCVVALGAFDGMHLGHRALIDDALETARGLGIHAVAVTFDPDPSHVLRPSSGEPELLSCEDRMRALSLEGLSAVVSVSFDEALANTPYERFADDILLGRLAMRELRAGADFRVGAGGAGDIALLAGLGEKRGFGVRGVALARHGGEVVSATRIRGLLAAGDVAGAAGLLGRCHFVRGEVVRGRGEGASMGFPTANIACDERACLPARGVYAGFVQVEDHAWPAAINVGSSPTLDVERQCFLEAALLGFEGDLYGAQASAVFCEMLRPERLFSSREELASVVLANIEQVRSAYGDSRLEVCA